MKRRIAVLMTILATTALIVGLVATTGAVGFKGKGSEGCTPGYWKQDQHFGSWTGYLPSQKFDTVFEDAFGELTLLQVLQQGGGGLNALGRHTVAALLNAASPDVDSIYNTTEVIEAFNGVYPGGDYEGLKNIFAMFNERGCPLGLAELNGG